MEGYTKEGLPIIKEETLNRMTEEAVINPDAFEERAMAAIEKEQPDLYRVICNIEESPLPPYCKELSKGLVLTTYMSFKEQAAINHVNQNPQK